MNDKELLELAAKAIGLVGYVDQNEDEFWFRVKAAAPFNKRRQDGDYWNPLTDDGDALQLAVKLKIDIQYDDISPIVSACSREITWVDEPHGEDLYAATRRAIVRAAASIGETM